MQNPPPKKHSDGITRRDLLKAGASAAALSMLGNRSTFATPILSGNPNEDAKRAVAQLRSELHKRPTDVAELQLDPDTSRKVSLPGSDNEYYARKREVLAYAADLKGHEKEYGDRETGIKGIRNLALGINDPKFDPDGSKLRRGMTTLFDQKYESVAGTNKNAFFMTPEMTTAYDVTGKMFVAGMSMAAGPLGGFAAGLAIDFAKDPTKYGGYGPARLETESLWKGLAADATRREYAEPQYYKKGDLDILGKMFGVDLAADLNTHLNNVSQGVKDYVKGALKSLEAGTPIDAKAFVEEIKGHISQELSKLKTSIADEVTARMREDAAAEAIARAEQQRLQGEIQGGAYLASWLGQTLLDPTSANTVSKFTNAAVSMSAMQTAISAGTMGPLGAAAAGISIMNGLLGGPPPDQVTQDMIKDMVKQLGEFMKEMRAQFKVVNQKLDYITDLQLETLKQLGNLYELCKGNFADMRTKLEEIRDIQQAEIERFALTSLSAEQKDFVDAVKDLKREYGDRGRRDRKIIQKAAGTSLRFATFTNGNTPAFTNYDVHTESGNTLAAYLPTIKNIAYGVGLIPSIYKNHTKKEDRPVLDTPLNPDILSDVEMVLAQTLDSFPEAETDDRTLAGYGAELKREIKKTTKTLVEATSAENIKKLSADYAKDAAEIYSAYLKEKYKAFMKKHVITLKLAPDTPRPGAEIFIEDEWIKAHSNTEINTRSNQHPDVGPKGYYDEKYFKRDDSLADERLKNGAININDWNMFSGGVTGLFCDQEGNLKKGKEIFGCVCGQSIIDLAQQYGLITIEEQKPEVIDSYEKTKIVPKDGKTAYLYRSTTEQKTYYNITFAKGKFSGGTIKICSANINSKMNADVAGPNLTQHFGEFKNDPATVISLANDSVGTSLNRVGDEPIKINNTQELLTLLGTELVEHHARIRKEFLENIRRDFTTNSKNPNNIKTTLDPNGDNGYSEKIDKLQAKGLSLRYLAGLRHWLDTGDMETATAIAKNGLPGAIPAFPEDFAKLGESVDEKGQYIPGILFRIPEASKDDSSEIMVDKMLKENPKKIEDAVSTLLQSNFPETKDRMVNVPEIVMAEIAMTGALASAEKREKAKPRGR